MRLSVTALTKHYGGSAALDQLSVTFEPGTVYGLFGRNGAGNRLFWAASAIGWFPTQGASCWTTNRWRNASG